MPRLLIPNVPGYTQIRSFYSREFNLKLTYVDPSIELELKHDDILYCHKPNVWRKALERSKEIAVSLLVADNEYYDSQIYREVQSLNCIKRVFLEYFPFHESRISINEIIKMIRQAPDVLIEKNGLGTFWKSYNKFRELRKIDFSIPLIPFPIGYTDRFVDELKNRQFEISTNSSVLNLQGIPSLSKRPMKVSYIGQRGSWTRRKILNKFKFDESAMIKTYSSFGGFPTNDGKTEYVDSLLDSRFVICPPGNRSNESFRYYESILLGAIPIATNRTLQDWFHFNSWTATNEFNSLDHNEIYRTLEQYSIQSLSSLQTKLKEDLKEQIAHLNSLLNK